jgi:hypothetical protein
MEPTPAPAPAAAPASAKKNNAPMIIGAVAAALLSLCCCGFSIPIFMGAGNYSGYIGDSTTSGTVPPYFGLVCVCAGIIPWLVVLIVFLVQRSKK